MSASPPVSVPLSVMNETVEAAVWERAPRSDAGDEAPTLVLIHGFRGDHHGLDLVADRLGRNRRVLVPDLPGFGRTPALRDRPHSIEVFVDFVRALLRDVGAPTVLVGHSFGSIVVAHAAADMLDEAAPETPSGLGLLNPISTPALKGPQKLPTLVARGYYALGSALPEGAGHALLAHPAIVRLMSEVMAKTRDPGLRRYIHDQHRRYFSDFADRSSLLAAFDTSVSHTVTEVAPRLAIPTAMLAGERDELATVAAQAALATTIPGTPRFPGAHLEVVRGVGHLTHYEAPDDAASLIDALATQVGEGRGEE